MTMRKAYASIRDRQAHYREAGAGEPLLLLHSTPRSSRSYRMLLPHLATHFRAIAVDLPGFGESDPLNGPLTMEALAEAMVEFLDVLRIERTHVFGYHTGNKVAAALAAHHPERVKGLILCGQIHSIIPEASKRNEAIRHLVDKYFTRFPGSPNGDEHLRRWLAEWSDVGAFALPRALFAKPVVSAQDIADLRSRVLDHVQALPSIEATYGANFTFDFAAALERITACTLVMELVMADEELYGRQLDKLCAVIKNSRGVTIQNAGTVALESHTEELARHITSFLCGPL